MMTSVIDANRLSERLSGLEGVAATALAPALESAAADFGGLARGRPLAIARPQGAEGLCALVALARAEGFALTPRQLGYSQSGQSLARDGVCVDMGGFGGIAIDRDAGTARCGSAVTWRELLAATAAQGLAPQVMPFNLDLTVGGLLSAGGIGSTSHRYGMAVSTADAITAVLGTGELVHASATQRGEVFEAVLGGVGQFGFLVDATLRLRAMGPMTRTWCLLYDDLATMLADELVLQSRPQCVHLEGFASAAVQGLRRGPTGRRAPFARWFGGLHVSTEFDESQPPDEAVLAGLRHRERVHVEDSPSTDYAARYDLRFEVMRATGAWQQPHPWFECMVPAESGLQQLPEAVTALPLFFGDGHRMMPIAEVARPRFVMQPPRPLGLAVLPMGIPPAFQGPALAAARALHDRLLGLGGKRYLSGWLFEPDEAAWRQHYGDAFDALVARKRALDPDDVLRSMLSFPR